MKAFSLFIITLSLLCEAIHALPTQFNNKFNNATNNNNNIDLYLPDPFKPLPITPLTTINRLQKRQHVTMTDKARQYFHPDTKYDDGRYDNLALAFFKEHPEAVEFQPKKYGIVKKRVLYFKTEMGTIYRLSRFIHEGTAGVMNEGFNIHTGEKVAIKRPFLDCLQEMFREISVMKQLSDSYHQMYRGMTKVRNAKTPDLIDRVYVVIQHVEGVDLYRFLKRDRLSMKQLDRLMESVADYLSFMWRFRHLHHGDLIPANIMLQGVDDEGNPIGLTIVHLAHSTIFKDEVPLDYRMHDAECFLSELKYMTGEGVSKMDPNMYGTHFSHGGAARLPIWAKMFIDKAMGSDYRQGGLNDADADVGQTDHETGHEPYDIE